MKTHEFGAELELRPCARGQLRVPGTFVRKPAPSIEREAKRGLLHRANSGEAGRARTDDYQIMSPGLTPTSREKSPNVFEICRG